MQRAYLASSRALSLAQVLIGLALVVTTLARGGGALALGLVLGLALTGLGGGRLWLARGARGGER